MKKDLGVNPYLFPMPVLMIATYGEDGVVDVMNMAWGGICAENMVSLNISEGHKTSENIKKRGAFTLSIADIPHIKEADFLGTASGNTMPDKFARSGLTAVKSEKVDAPVIQEFPISLECKVVEDKTEVYGHHVLGEAQRLCFRSVPERLLRDRREARPCVEHRQGVFEKVNLRRKNPLRNFLRRG